MVCSNARCATHQREPARGCEFPAAAAACPHPQPRGISNVNNARDNGSFREYPTTERRVGRHLAGGESVRRRVGEGTWLEAAARAASALARALVEGLRTNPCHAACRGAEAQREEEEVQRVVYHILFLQMHRLLGRGGGVGGVFDGHAQRRDAGGGSEVRPARWGGGVSAGDGGAPRLLSQRFEYRSFEGLLSTNHNAYSDRSLFG